MRKMEVSVAPALSRSMENSSASTLDTIGRFPIRRGFGECGPGISDGEEPKFLDCRSNEERLDRASRLLGGGIFESFLVFSYSFVAAWYLRSLWPEIRISLETSPAHLRPSKFKIENSRSSTAFEKYRDNLHSPVHRHAFPRSAASPREFASWGQSVKKPCDVPITRPSSSPMQCSTPMIVFPCWSAPFAPSNIAATNHFTNMGRFSKTP
jgi:hypothetical protein